MARDVMHVDCAYLGINGNLTDAAQRMADPADVKVGDLIEQVHHLWRINADANVDEVLHQTAEHKIRRLPVPENKGLVGVISQTDLAAKLPEDMVGELVEAISSTSQ